MKRLLIAIACFISLGVQAQDKPLQLRKTVSGLIYGADQAALRDTLLSFRLADTRYAKIGDMPTLGTSNISLGGATKGLSFLSGNYRLHKVTATTGGVLTTGSDTISGAKTFNSDIIVNDVNIGIGGGAGNAFNTRVGKNALLSNTTGSGNIALGYSALKSNTSGDYNTGIGYNSLNINTEGEHNSSLGNFALGLNTTGKNNTAIGYGALYDNTTANNNTAIGHTTGLGITTGSNNTIIGANVTGLYPALSDNIILANGSGNIKAQHDNTNWNLTGGVSATNTISSAQQGTLYGTAAGSITSSQLKSSLYDETGTGLVVFSQSPTFEGVVTTAGIEAYSNTGVTIFGFNSGVGATAINGYSTQGSGGIFQSTSQGSAALVARNTSSTGPLQYWLNGFGIAASVSNEGNFEGSAGTFSAGITSQSAFFGTRSRSQSLFAGTGAGNESMTGGSNAVFGELAGNLMTTGSSNTLIGRAAGSSQTSAESNTLIGQSAGVSITTGSSNTFLGTDSGSGITTGSGNTIIGRAYGLSASLSNNIILANGDASIKAQHNGTNWTFTGGATITGRLSLGSNITNGTYTYTLPSATGTLALTSDLGGFTLTTTGTSGAATFISNTLNIPNYGDALSSYLPLSGGTLTGPLIGTSATFTKTDDTAISGNSVDSYGIYGSSTNSSGIYGDSNIDAGVFGLSTSGNGIKGQSISGVAGYFRNNIANTSHIADFEGDDELQAFITYDGKVNAKSFVKTGGTSSQFLKADGSVSTTISDAIISTRKFSKTIVIGTNANITAQAGSSYHLPPATLTSNRNIDMSLVNLEGDYIEIFNQEAGFTFTFTGTPVYLSDGLTTVTTLLAETNYLIRFINGKLRILN